MDPENAFPFRVLGFSSTQIRQQTLASFFQQHTQTFKVNYLWQISYKKNSCNALEAHVTPSFRRIVIHAQLDACKQPYSHSLFPLCHFLIHQYLQFLWANVRLLGHPSLFCYAEEIGSLQVNLTTVTETTRQCTLKHWSLSYS